MQKGLVGHWSMNDEDTDSGTIRDRSPYDNHGNKGSGIITGVSSPIGEGYDFSGTKDYISVSDVAPLGQIPFTVSFWIRGDTTHYTDSDGNEIRYPDVFRHSADNTIGYWGRGADSFYRMDSLSTSRYLQFSLPDVYDTWSHVTILFDHNAIEARGYVDGELYNSDSASALEDFGAGDQLGIGATYNGSAPTRVDISDFRIYNRVLSQTEIATLSNMRAYHQRYVD